MVTLVAPATGVIAATVEVSVTPPGQVVLLLGLSSMTSPVGSVSTQLIELFAVSGGFEIVKVRVETWPTFTIDGKNDLDNV